MPIHCLKSLDTFTVYSTATNKQCSLPHSGSSQEFSWDNFLSDPEFIMSTSYGQNFQKKIIFEGSQLQFIGVEGEIDIHGSGVCIVKRNKKV